MKHFIWNWAVLLFFLWNWRDHLHPIEVINIQGWTLKWCRTDESLSSFAVRQDSITLCLVGGSCLLLQRLSNRSWGRGSCTPSFLSSLPSADKQQALSLPALPVLLSSEGKFSLAGKMGREGPILAYPQHGLLGSEHKFAPT